MAALATWIARRLHDSWLGLALNTLRDDEIAARCCGVSVTREKLVAFSIGNFLIGLGGSFYAVMVGLRVAARLRLRLLARDAER